MKDNLPEKKTGKEAKETAEKERAAQESKKEERTETAPTETSALEQKQKELEELTELLKRTQASFENYRKNTEKRLEEFQQLVTKDLLLQLLPLLDNFELALKTSTNNIEDLKKGVEMIYSQLFTLLESQGLELIPTENKRFDLYYHEALIKEESSESEGTILEELQKGFLLNGRVIRHAKVKISSGKKTENKEGKRG
ncbi:nucleotide exchange factor GrpE [Candidatus Woesearchaeota archaeon]|nr:nucleotide exchange factor GrpE [Candidatus Woesearchaeota archaeon]